MVRELTASFKDTAIGPLPVEWEVVRLGDAFEIQQGKALSRKHQQGISPYPFLRTANVRWGKIDLSTVDEMDFTDEETDKYALQLNDLLVCEGGEIGRTAMWRQEPGTYCYQNHLHRLRTTQKDILPAFYMYWMQAAFLLLNAYLGVAIKTTIPNLSQSRLSGFLLPKPPLPEQRRIAHVLSTLQQAIAAQEDVIAAARELKRSLMQRLFTYGSGPEPAPTQETEIGVIPAHWEIVQLGNVLETTQYGLSVRADHTSRFPMLRMNNLSDGRVDISDLKYVDLDEDGFAKFRMRKGDVLFNRTNSYELVGKTAIFDLEGDFVFASYLIRVVPHVKRLLPEYLNYYLNWRDAQDRLRMLATRGVSQSNISATKLKRFVIGLPPVAEQEESIGFLLAVDAKIAAEKQRQAALQALFQSALQQLMTGQIRVDGNRARGPGVFDQAMRQFDAPPGCEAGDSQEEEI